MFTAQRLLGVTPAPASDLLAHEAFLVRARLERTRGADEAARIVLGAYAAARLIDRALASGFPLDDTFALERSSVRRYLAGLPGGHPEVAHLAGILEAIDAPATLRLSLMGYAYWLEHEARLDEAHEVLELAVRSWPGEIPPEEFGQVALFFARIDRRRARWPAAAAACHAAEEAGTVTGDLETTLRARLQRGAVARGQGNLPETVAIAEQAARDAETAGLHDVRAGALADLGAVLMVMGRRVEALCALYDSFRGMTEPMGRMRVLGDLGIGLAESGAHDAARIALNLVAHSPDGEQLIRVNARIELMDVESAAGNRLAFEQLRGSVRGFADQMPPSMAVDYRYKAGLGLARFGQQARARALWEEALKIAEAQGLNAWYFRLEGLLSAADEPAAAPAASTTSTTDLGFDTASAPEIVRLTRGLREYAGLAGAGA